MTSNYSLTPQAKADLEGIWNYTVDNWGIDQADKYIRQLYNQFELLADNPDLGKKRDEVKAGYRSFPEGNHVIFYMLLPDKRIAIIGIPHQKEDVELHFQPFH